MPFEDNSDSAWLRQASSAPVLYPVKIWELDYLKQRHFSSTERRIEQVYRRAPARPAKAFLDKLQQRRSAHQPTGHRQT
jgi:hypothetical protein